MSNRKTTKTKSLVVPLVSLSAFLVVLGLFVGFFAFGRNQAGQPFKPTTIITKKNNIQAASVKITNRAGNSGGTGLILRSTISRSYILTNAHVCKVVENGATVRTKTDVYQVESYLKSVLSDLCLVTVADDLKLQTTLSPSAPSMYEKAAISGHPNLLPNVVSTGHVSGREIVQVFIGVEACTADDLSDNRKMMFCIFFGGIPIIKSYESVLVTATIMPGSSGSGVYNANDELIGLVFAGSGELGYAWTVPYEQVLNFLKGELHHNLNKFIAINQRVDLESFSHSSKDYSLRDLKQKCLRAEDPQIKQVCDVVSKNILWEK